jgi:hypothetical protein
MNISQEEQNSVIQFFLELANLVSEKERQALKETALKSNLDSWKKGYKLMITGSGAASGALPLPLALMAIFPDLVFCGKVATQTCFGIGHILGKEVDYDLDMNHITAIWAGIAKGERTVPEGKTGIEVIALKSLPIKVAIKPATKVAGKVLAKATLKASTKIVTKLSAKAASKASAKLIAKFFTKVAVSWVPLLGAVVSAWVNNWLVDGLVDSAIEYYANPYVTYDNADLDDS